MIFMCMLCWYVSSWFVVIVWHTVYLHRDQAGRSVQRGARIQEIVFVGVRLSWGQHRNSRRAGSLLLVPTSYWLKGVSSLVLLECVVAMW